MSPASFGNLGSCFTKLFIVSSWTGTLIVLSFSAVHLDKNNNNNNNNNNNDNNESFYYKFNNNVLIILPGFWKEEDFLEDDELCNEGAL